MDVDFRQIDDSIVLTFGGEFKRIKAYTLAKALVSIADAVKAANSEINPGYDIEVYVEAFGEGSFRAQIKALNSKAGNIFSAENLKQIVLAVVATFIYEFIAPSDPEIRVINNANEVIIERGQERIIVPKEVHDALPRVGSRPAFRSSIADVFSAVDDDKEIQSIGITASLDSDRPLFTIPRDDFATIAAELVDQSVTSRVIDEEANLQIIRAILERSSRRWEFVWQGIRISAPVLDAQFYDDFFAHDITIAPGDALRVTLRIHQERHRDLGIFMNKKYEVLEVHEHKPRYRQEVADFQ